MAEIDIQHNQQPSWSFKSTSLELLPRKTARSWVSPIARVAGRIIAMLGEDTPDSTPTTELGDRLRSVVLHTSEGPVHYYCRVNPYSDIGEIAIEYPKTANPIPEGLLIDLQGVEEKDGRAVDDPESALDTEVVIGGKLGRFVLPPLSSIALVKNWNSGYVEEQSHKNDVATVQGLEDRFMQHAINIGSHLGGVTQLTAHIHEKGPGTRSFHAMGTNHGQPAVVVGKELSRHGYKNVVVYERTPGKTVGEGYKVVVGTKDEETVVAHEGMSPLLYGRGFRQWRLVRGVMLRDAVTVDDIKQVVRPLSL